MTLPEDLDLDRLAEIRRRFLAAGESHTGLEDYWKSSEDLRHYDLVFAERIGWKWDAVLEELQERAPRFGEDLQTVVDWGCGTGIAARRIVKAFSPDRVLLHDRSERAMHFATSRLKAEGTDAGRLADQRDVHPDLLIISHVLDELKARDLEQVLELAERSRRVIWVEPGTQRIGRHLSTLRERLRVRFAILAPCTHQAACPCIAPGEQEHWCHFFATPPSEIFCDSAWVKVSKGLGIDIRALPYSFLALESSVQKPDPATQARMIGRPRVLSKLARYWACSAEGLEQREIIKAQDRDLHKRLKKGPAPRLI